MKNYTKIPNEILGPCQLSLPSKMLYCILLKYCGKDEWCFPGQARLADDMGYKSSRCIRNILGELQRAELIYKKRRGFNKSNTYHVAKELATKRSHTSCPQWKYDSYHLSSEIPLHEGTVVPPKSTYLKGKDKTNHVGFEKMRKTLEAKGILPRTRILVKKM